MFATLLFIAGCQSTEPKTTKLQITQPKIAEPVISVADLNQHTFVKTPALKAPAKEQTGIKPPFRRYSKHPINIKNNNDKSSPLLNQQACRNNVEVTYQVIDQRAVVGTYQAQVQAQGVILEISDDNKLIKLKTTGWFTENENLHNWQPYLTTPPLTNDISLEIGAEFWDNKNNWQLCNIN